MVDLVVVLFYTSITIKSFQLQEVLWKVNEVTELKLILEERREINFLLDDVLLGHTFSKVSPELLGCFQ